MTGQREAVSYEAFARAFVAAAVTPARIEAAVRTIAGDRIELGPLAVGPAGVARAQVSGDVGAVTARRHDAGGQLAFTVVIAIALDLEVLVSDRRHRFRADVEVPLHLLVTTAVPPALVIEVTPPRSREVRVDVQARGVQAKVLGRVGSIDVQICQQAAQYVRDQLDGPAARSVMDIELAELIERAWPG